MKTRARRLLLVAVSVAALALVVVLTPTGQAAAQGMMNALMVEVINTPTVNAQQSGSWNVGVNGGVNVANAATNPVLQRDVDHPAHAFFAQKIQCDMAPGELFCSANFAVPSGRLLVIETVSALANFSLAAQFPLLQFRVGLPPSSFLYQLPMQPLDPAATDSYVGIEAVRLYAPPGSSVVLEVGRGGGSFGPGTVVLTVSGHLVDCGAGPGCPIP